MDPDDSFSTYVKSVYFILQTITTVGYGDCPGSTQYEYLFSMALEVRIEYVN